MQTSQPQQNLTPLMQQYFETKQKAGDALLFFRMGDFYELFGEDAQTAARLLSITLTSRDKNKENAMPMAGVPHHSAQGYIQKLLNAGYKVAIAEQMEPEGTGLSETSGKASKTIVRREIVRTYTPAVQFNVEGNENRFLAAIEFKSDSKKDGKQGSISAYLALIEPSTGETLLSQALHSGENKRTTQNVSLTWVTWVELVIQELLSHSVAHVLVRDADFFQNSDSPIVQGITRLKERLKSEVQALLFEVLPQNILNLDQAQGLLRSHFEVQDLSALVPDTQSQMALGVALHYTLKTQRLERLAHLRRPRPFYSQRGLKLGPRTAQHLDLLPTQERDSAASHSSEPNLFAWLNHTRTSLGARELKRWMLEPLTHGPAITERQDAIRVLSQNASVQGPLRERLGEVYDLERILSRIQAGLANPRDTYALGVSLSVLPVLMERLELTTQSTPLLEAIRSSFKKAWNTLEPISSQILKTQKTPPPLLARDGEIFELGTDPELDRLIGLNTDGQRFLIELETREREATGINTLKVRYNRVFGYYIEITQSHLKNVPSHYQRKQTMVGAERFFTEELKKFEEEILSAEFKQKALELKLFQDLTETLRAETSSLMEVAQNLGALDVLQSLAQLSLQPGMCFPSFDHSHNLSIEAGRHPLVDQASAGKFVPNSIQLDLDAQTLLITGPNMGGKSTVMRQVALLVLLGQMGAPIPAKSAQWGIFSSIYTRIGAHDAIAKGQSTFMVEMSELAHLLHHADERSLIVLDEIGRGTSTYDGMSVAWATLEWICNHTRARTLFATHYHELTQLEGQLKGLKNAHMAVDQSPTLTPLKGAQPSGSPENTLRFLFELRSGPTADSYGIQVAQLAGLPPQLIERAWSVLSDLEANEPTKAPPSPSSTLQGLPLFEVATLSQALTQTTFELNQAKAKIQALEAMQTNPTEQAYVEELRALNLDQITPLKALLWIAEKKNAL